MTSGQLSYISSEGTAAGAFSLRSGSAHSDLAFAVWVGSSCSTGRSSSGAEVVWIGCGSGGGGNSRQ